MQNPKLSYVACLETIHLLNKQHREMKQELTSLKKKNFKATI